MFKPKKPAIKVTISKAALEAIFDECDKYQIDETGGRIIGIYKKKGHKYEIEVTGVIEPGPNARRSTTSFFQDGEYQEQIFRSVEEKNHHIEHLGNWHTHHVNGYPTLSMGDKATYQRIVNHGAHNTDFFYAILVVEKTPESSQRYKIKHFFLRRKDPEVYEIPNENVQITNKPIVWPVGARVGSAAAEHKAADANLERAKDKDFFEEFYPNFRALLSKTLGMIYWKGKLDLIDGTSVEVVLIESDQSGTASYSVAISGGNIAPNQKDRTFKSARQALLKIEKELSREIYLNKE